jgi:hypothetical protein
MRKLLWIGLATVAIGCAAGIWFYLANSRAANSNLGAKGDTGRVSQKNKGDGDGEPSDEVEPLVVDPGPPQVFGKAEAVLLEGEFGAEMDTVLRAILEPGMKQPPRPDVEPGKAPRMPYADEEVPGVAKDPPTVKIVDEVEKANPTEESEVKEPAPMSPERPTVDSHPQHCPFMGGCPAPYPYRVTPR